MKKGEKMVRVRWLCRVGSGRVVVALGQKVRQGEVVAVGRMREKVVVKDGDIRSILGANKSGVLTENFRGREVTLNKLQEIGLLLKEERLPDLITGKFVGVDEFGNFNFEKDSDEKREILAPVNSVVVAVKEDRVVVEFEAMVVDGEAVGVGKAWGDIVPGVINKLGQINYESKGKILVVDKLSAVMALKAKVMGVSGIIFKDNDDNWDNLEKAGMLGLKLEDGLWKDLVEEVEMGRARGLLNCSSSRLVLVVE